MKPLLKNCVYDGYDFALSLNYFDGIGSALKPFRGIYIGNKVHPLFRSWKINKRIIDENEDEFYAKIIEVAGPNFIDDKKSFFNIIENAEINPDITAFNFGIKERIYSIQNEGVAIVGDYHPRIISTVKAMGGRYLPTMRAWKLDASPFILKSNLVYELALNEDQIEIMEGSYALIDDAFTKTELDDAAQIHVDNNALAGEKGINEIEADDIYLAVVAPRTNSQIVLENPEETLKKYGLYDFQEIGVMHLISNTSALLGDDMGLGKSRQAATAADILRNLQPEENTQKLLIICPASLIINWEREIQMIDPDGKIATQKWDPEAKWIVTNYERLEELIKYAHHFLVMIIDEAHMLKEVTSIRTIMAFDIAAKIVYRFLLTGTPVLNRECEIHTLLKLSGHPIGNIPLKQFEKEFAGSSTFRLELNKRISEWMLRRKKEAVLKTLKGKNRQLHYVGITEQQRLDYEDIADDDTLLSLPKITKLRQYLEQIKMSSVIEMVQEMKEDDKTLIFCEFVDTVSELQKRLKEVGIEAVTVIGEDSTKKRMKAVDAFQNDKNVRVFIGTTRAAGIGINLTAANYVIFASLPWTAALKDQAEDRAYRNGQTRLVIVKIPLIENTIEMDIWELLKHKHEIALDIIDPDAAEDHAMEIFAMQKTKEILAKFRIPNTIEADYVEIKENSTVLLN
jgi:SNF2 family DNA or RNA helicase